MFVSCLLLFLVEETPLFLLSRRKFKEFKELILRIAKINNKEISADFENYGQVMRGRSVNINPREDEQPTNENEGTSFGGDHKNQKHTPVKLLDKRPRTKTFSKKPPTILDLCSYA